MSVSDFVLFGRWHPLLLHVPIGFLVAALFLEIVATRGKLTRPALGLFLWLAAVAAVVTAASGWVLSHEEGYGGETVAQHERLGIAVAIAAVVAALVHDPRGRSTWRLGLHRAALVAGCVLLVPAGHLGSTLTHGADWLDGPRRPAASVVSTGAPSATTETPSAAQDPAPSSEDTARVRLADEALAVFAERCTSCHGAKKHKGGLRLDSRAAMLAGGDSGPALALGDAAASLLFQRLSLPLEHEDHMPPEGKPQPSADERARIEAWIAAGAPEGSASATQPAGSELPSATPEQKDEGTARAEPVSGGAQPGEPEPGDELRAPDTQAASPPSEALLALDQAFVHHEPLGAEGPELRIDVAATATAFGDVELSALLEPLAPWIAELSLARSRVGDASLATLARFPVLRSLDLRATSVSDAGLAALRDDPTLVELNLAQTELTDAALETLLSLPALTRLTLWNAGLSVSALARLRSVPGLRVVAGDEPEAAVLETEDELTFTSDRPLPGAELVPEALRPVNTVCPVSGDPVNPKYALVHTFADGTRVIGFCCPNCPKEFWSDPEKYAAALR